MSLVPLSNYVFFLAQLQTFGYLLVYFTVLALRYRRVLYCTALPHYCLQLSQGNPSAVDAPSRCPAARAGRGCGSRPTAPLRHCLGISS